MPPLEVQIEPLRIYPRTLAFSRYARVEKRRGALVVQTGIYPGTKIVFGPTVVVTQAVGDELDQLLDALRPVKGGSLPKRLPAPRFADDVLSELRKTAELFNRMEPPRRSQISSGLESSKTVTSAGSRWKDALR